MNKIDPWQRIVSGLHGCIRVTVQLSRTPAIDGSRERCDAMMSPMANASSIRRIESTVTGRVLPLAQHSRRLHTDWQLSAKKRHSSAPSFGRSGGASATASGHSIRDAEGCFIGHYRNNVFPEGLARKLDQATNSTSSKRRVFVSVELR
jgi:hypothetical protein